MARPRVLVTTTFEFRGRSPGRQLLEEAGCEVVQRPPRPGWPDDETRAKLEGFEALLAGAENINEATMERAGRMKVIARNGVGYDKIDLDYCTGRGIVVTNTPGAMADAVADHTFALLLACVRQIAEGDRRLKQGGEYDVPMGEDLAAMSLGLVGCGRIGAEVVRRALAFKMRVLVCDPWVEDEKIEALGAVPVPLHELLRQADALSLHTPLTRENQNMVDAAFLARMRKGAFLINTARGGLVDESALIAALQSGHLAGAGLDCQASEPPEGLSLELVRLPNVVAAPHSGSKTLAARERMSEWAARSIADVLQGRVPEYVVNREVLEKLDLR